MIAVFDSGLGGLTALSHLLEVAPEDSYVYFGDLGRVPYGGRSQETILRYSLQALSFLETFAPRAVLVACGTVSANALRVMEAAASCPVYGVILPAAAAAVAATKNGKVAVLGTAATIRTHAYRHALLAAEPKLSVWEVACPLFVPLVEQGLCDPDDVAVESICRRTLAPLAAAGVDTVVLGCTHYPLLGAAIARVLPHAVQIDVGRAAVSAVCPYTEVSPRPSVTCYVSDCTDTFTKTASRFLGTARLTAVRRVTMEGF